MKKYFLKAFAIVILMSSCSKNLKEAPLTDLVARQEVSLICGTDHSGESIPADIKEQLLAQRTNSLRASLMVYLDFNGELVFPGFSSSPNITNSFILSGPRSCPAPSLTAAQIDIIISLIEDDFAPFNIQFTTNRTVYDAFPSNSRMICVFTTFGAVIGRSNSEFGVSPFSPNGSFISSQACFVFADAISNSFLSVDDEIFIASVASQELGHLLGLNHQHQFTSTCTISSEYNAGSGTGALGFSPIMGIGHRRITTWWAQPCQSQIDFNAINNVVELKADDFPDSPGDWTEVQGGFKGTLGHPGDVDFIFIRPLTPTAIQVTADNIDLQVSYCAPGGAVIATYNDPGDTHVTIPRLAGLGFIKIEAASNANLQSQFMTGNYVVTYLDK